VVKFPFNLSKHFIGQLAEVRTFRDVLAYQPVRVLVCATLPGVVWACEVELGIESLRYLLMAGEFLSVVSRYRYRWYPLISQFLRISRLTVPVLTPITSPISLRLIGVCSNASIVYRSSLVAHLQSSVSDSITKFFSQTLAGFIFVTYICKKKVLCPSYSDNTVSSSCSSLRNMSPSMFTCAVTTGMLSSIETARVS